MRISDWSSDVCSSDLGDHLTWGAFTKFAHQPNRYFRPGEPAQHTLGGFKPRARTGLGASIALFRMRAPCYYLSITLESQAMGMRADRDLWGQALAATAGWETALPTIMPPPSETKAANAIRQSVANASRRRNAHSPLNR